MSVAGLDRSQPIYSSWLSIRPVLVALAAIILAVALAALVPDFLPVLPSASLFIVSTCVTWRRLSPVALSPGFYFAAYMALVAICGIVFTNVLVGSGGTGGVDVFLDPAIGAQTANWMLVGASITLFAAALGRGKGKGNGELRNIFNLGEISRYAGWFLMFGTIELVTLLYFLGVSEFFERPFRLVGRGSNIEGLIGMAAIAAVVPVGIAIFTRRNFTRLYAILLLVGYAAYFMSLGSRRFALLPLLLLLAYAISRRGQVRFAAVLVAGALALLLLALPLHFRGQPTHGLIPYVSSLSTFTLSPEVIATSLNNFLAGFKITAITGFMQPAIPIEVLWVSVSPADGDWIGWYEISRSLRLNIITPYSGIGELINYGKPAFGLVIVGLGIVLGLIQRLNDRLLGDTLGRFIVILSLGLIFIFVIQSAQYNFRSEVRYVYFALSAQLAGLTILWIRNEVSRRVS